MEAMDYNYYATTPQPYHFMGYGDNGLIHNVGQEVVGAAQSLEDPVDPGFMPGAFDYHFDTSINHGNRITPLPATSASPPARKLSMLHNGSVDSGISLDMENEPQGRRSSSEEKESLTPAQSRRKAQNRAAQRAFRERKERHVRDLEAKLDLLTTTTSSLQSDNERLKLLLQRAQTENEILRATASSSSSSSSPGSNSNPPSFVDDPSLMGQPRSLKNTSELQLNRAKLANGILSTEAGPKPGLSSDNGGNLLSASATWDLLQSHPLYLSGTIDISEICERLKKLARCDGLGPMFDEAEVRTIIEEVGQSGSDDLI